MNRDSNIYTFLFVGIMVIGIASILAFTSQTLKPMQKENVKNEKMQNILSTVGINVSREEIQSVIGERSEHIVNLFNTLIDRVDTILYARGLDEPDKTTLRWLEYCNIKDHDPEADILKEFEILLKVDG